MTDSSGARPHLHINSQCLYLKAISPSFPLNIPWLDEMVPARIPTPLTKNGLHPTQGLRLDSRVLKGSSFADLWPHLHRTEEPSRMFISFPIILPSSGFPNRIQTTDDKISNGKKNIKKSKLCKNGFDWVLLWRGAAVCSLTEAVLGCHQHLTHTGEGEIKRGNLNPH